MKPSSRIHIALLFFLTMSLSGIAQNRTGSILGTWYFNYQASKDRMDTKMKDYFGKLSVERQDKIRASYQGRKVTFNEDGGFVQINSDGSNIRGTWELRGNENMVEITYPDGMVYPQLIKQLTGNRLVLVPEDIGKGMLFFKEWHFVKN